jgi:hypothetical protein
MGVGHVHALVGRESAACSTNVTLQRRPPERSIGKSIIQLLLDSLRLRIAGAVGEGAPLQWQNAAPAKGL